MTLRAALLLGGLVLGLQAGRCGADAPSQQEFSCAQGPVTRTVRIVSMPPSDKQPHGSCRVDYTKDRTTKTLWSSHSGNAYCLKQATAFVTKLAEAHYSCTLKTTEHIEK